MRTRTTRKAYVPMVGAGLLIGALAGLHGHAAASEPAGFTPAPDARALQTAANPRVLAQLSPEGRTPDTPTNAPGTTRGYSSERGTGSDVGGADDKRGVGELFEDGAITSQVKFRLLRHERLSGFDIGVETDQGVVSLSGEVNSEAERDLAVEVASGIEGVKQVNNDGLKVK